MLQRIREACKDDNDDDFLGGIVEIDEAYVSGLENNKHTPKRTEGTQGRSTKTKKVVVGTRSRDGRVKAKSMDRVNTRNMQEFMGQKIAQRSTISMDEATFYKRIRGYHHVLVNHSVGEFVNGMASTNEIESMWAVLKRGYQGTLHHFSKKHIDRYIDEFVFRMNDGNVRVHTLDRIDAMVGCAFGKRLTYANLIG